MAYYYAYGVNLYLSHMREYCPGAEFLGPAHLPGHRLIFDGQSNRRPGATANIREEKDQIVWGVLLKIGQKELDELDKFENYPISYLRKRVTVFSLTGLGYTNVWVYYRKGAVEGKPGTEYFSEVLAGARMCELPPYYIKDLEAVETL